MSPTRRGFTLIEATLVVVLIATLGVVVVMRVGAVAPHAQETATRASLARVREAVLAWSVDRPDGQLPPTLRALLVQDLDPDPGVQTLQPAFDPVSGLGWRGPYLVAPGSLYRVDAARGFTSEYGSDDPADPDPAPLDAWGHPIVLQYPTTAPATPAERARYVRLVSAGPDGAIDTPQDVLEPAAAAIDDDLVLFVHEGVLR